MFDLLPPAHGGSYFAIALANWAINYSTRRRPEDCWWIVRVNITVELISYPREFMAADPYIVGRYRHPSGRMYTRQETIPVVNALNDRSLAVLAASTSIGGVGKFVRSTACALLNLDQQGEPL